MKYILRISIVSAGLFVAFGVFAQANPFNINFPIAELGDCGSVAECKTYCDDPANVDACVAWAQSQGIDVGSPQNRPQVEVPPEGGPGGCLSENECRSYCGQPENFDECTAFAADHGLISKEEAERNSRLRAGGPGGCQGQAECESYCSHPENQNECIDFAEREGFMSQEEAERARQEIGKTGPGGCITREQCDTYCSNPDNTAECVQHAVDNGFMSQEEADRALQFLEAGLPGRHVGPRGPERPPGPNIDEAKARELISTVGGPGGCSTFDECDRFCSVPGNDQVCMDYAIEHSLISSEERQRAEKMMNIEGPGGCRGRECESYCDAPGHELECIEFAHDQGFMGDEEYKQVKKFLEVSGGEGPGGCRGRECETYCGDPAHQDECFNFAKENGLIDSKEIERVEKIENKMKESGGPGGCRTEVDCRKYCSDTGHFDECAAFAVDTGLLSPDDAKGMLRQFIDIERRGPGDGFGPPPGFGPSGGPGFGSSSGEFPGRPENFPPDQFGPPPGFNPANGHPGFSTEDSQDFNSPPGVSEEEFQREFERRFQNFEKFREGFEQGDSRGDFGPPPDGRFREDFHPEDKIDDEGNFPARPGEFPVQGEFPGRPENFPPDQFGPPPGFNPANGQPGFSPEDSQDFNSPPGVSEEEFQREFERRFQEGIDRQQAEEGDFRAPVGTPSFSGEELPLDARTAPAPQGVNGPEGSVPGTFPPPEGEFSPPDAVFPPPDTFQATPGGATVFGTILNVLLSPFQEFMQ